MPDIVKHINSENKVEKIRKLVKSADIPDKEIKKFINKSLTGKQEISFKKNKKNLANYDLSKIYLLNQENFLEFIA